MSYYLVTIFNIGDASRAQAIQEIAMEQFSCTGVEEYSIDEARVDEILGTRSYSGGDLPLEVLDEVDQIMNQGQFHNKFFFDENSENKASDFLNAIKNQFLCESQIEKLEDQDWNTEWKKHYRPIDVTEKFSIIPAWEDVSLFKHKNVIRIHPGMGFGTGSHETTFLCLKNYLNLELPQDGVVLDYGSGSGILGLSVLLMNKSWMANMVDIDPEAHRNCLQNMELNAIDPVRVEMNLLDARPTTTFPLVFANILQNILHDERDYLISVTLPGHYLILSGLLKNQLSETCDYYLQRTDLVLFNKEILNDWGCLVFRRNS